jgi:mannosyltransferase OCH1-like enzyme
MISIHHHYGEEYFRLHQKLIPTAYQADFWRYLILKQYGGCYGDFSQIPLVPYDKITEGVDRVFVRDDPSNRSYLYNAFMCVKAGDDVVNKAVEISVDNIRNNKHDNHPLGIVGPKVLGEGFIKQGYKKYFNNPDISIGTYKGSKILRNLNGVVQDEFENNIFINKLGNHVSVVYGNTYGKLHYHQAWTERRVYKY